MDLRQQQIQHEASLNHSLIGKEFYVLCPDNPKYFRSVFIKRNIFTGMPQTMVSPCVYAVPPDGIPDGSKEIDPKILSQIRSMNNALPYTI